MSTVQKEGVRIEDNSFANVETTYSHDRESLIKIVTYCKLSINGPTISPAFPILYAVTDINFKFMFSYR